MDHDPHSHFTIAVALSTCTSILYFWYSVFSMCRFELNYLLKLCLIVLECRLTYSLLLYFHLTFTRFTQYLTPAYTTWHMYTWHLTCYYLTLAPIMIYHLPPVMLILDLWLSYLWKSCTYYPVLYTVTCIPCTHVHDGTCFDEDVWDAWYLEL